MRCPRTTRNPFAVGGAWAITNDHRLGAFIRESSVTRGKNARSTVLAWSQQQNAERRALGHPAFDGALSIAACARDGSLSHLLTLINANRRTTVCRRLRAWTSPRRAFRIVRLAVRHSRKVPRT